MEAYPVGWRTHERVSFYPADVLGGGLARLDSAAREWIGIVANWLTGQTSELLPGPAAAN